MTEPMPPQRLEEIRAIGNQLRDHSPEAPERIRAELLAEVDRLTKALADLQSELDSDGHQTCLDFQELKRQYDQTLAMLGESNEQHVGLKRRVAELEARLTAPCDGTDCEQGGAIHCHACPEAEADKLLAERDEARQIAAEITRGATRLHGMLRVTLGSVQKLIDPQRHTPDRVCRYLGQQGWTRLRETATGSDWTWGTPVTQWASVPGSTHYTDYARRIAMVVVDAADVHGTGELRVLADIEGVGGEPLPEWLTADADTTKGA